MKKIKGVKATIIFDECNRQFQDVKDIIFAPSDIISMSCKVDDDHSSGEGTFEGKPEDLEILSDEEARKRRPGFYKDKDSDRAKPKFLYITWETKQEDPAKGEDE